MRDPGIPGYSHQSVYCAGVQFFTLSVSMIPWYRNAAMLYEREDFDCPESVSSMVMVIWYAAVTLLRHRATCAASPVVQTGISSFFVTIMFPSVMYSPFLPKVRALADVAFCSSAAFWSSGIRAYWRRTPRPVAASPRSIALK